jgi:FAD/FMN-containing dehydrogenase
MSNAQLISDLEKIVGARHVLTTPSATRRFRKGFRFGDGPALAVVRPASLVEMWRSLRACSEAGKIVLMQAANTGLTGGSTPDGDTYDREIVIISTLRVAKIHLIRDGKQVICRLNQAIRSSRRVHRVADAVAAKGAENELCRKRFKHHTRRNWRRQARGRCDQHEASAG